MIRTRFAPSPTGFLHVGGLRTALYNYLFARKNKGVFILRIEDTDRTRYVEGALESLLKTLEQVGLEYDEGPGKNGKFGPYIQSERTEIYRGYAQELLDKKAAYPCFCTAERLEEMRKKQTEAKKAPMYDRTCLSLTSEEIESKMKQGIPYVIRQKIPHGRFLKFKDLIRGKVSFETLTIDDQVLIKSDHFPTYHLANVVDDHLMEITQVIRGEEWLPSTPKHLLLYEAFGWNPPEFAHIPLLLNKDKSKLSKRQGDVSVESYLEKGTSKEALLNFIALLGWHPGKGIEQEIFSLEELIEAFSLEQVHKAGAIFDLEKLNWFNFQWQRELLEQQLLEKAQEMEAQVSKWEAPEDQKKAQPEPKTDLEKFVSVRNVIFSLHFKSLEEIQTFEQYESELLLKKSQKYLPENWLTHREFLYEALRTIREKILKNPQEAAEHIRFFFELPNYPSELFLNPKMEVADFDLVKKVLTESEKIIQTIKNFSTKETVETFSTLAQNLQLKNKQLLWPLRVALTGQQYSPGVFEVLEVLGKEEALKRIQKAMVKLEAKRNEQMSK
jgi:glutamyl-tRNA synthetase